MQDTVLVKNGNLLSFLAEDLDLDFAEGVGNVVHPKAALLSLYRALNQLSCINNRQGNMKKSTKCLSAEEITELCDIIRYCRNMLFEMAIWVIVRPYHYSHWNRHIYDKSTFIFYTLIYLKDV